jgi:hypothetical protein
MKERETKLRELRGRYAKYGENVMAVVMQYQAEHGNLRRLVHRVTGRVVRDSEQQHEVLLEYLVRHGEAVFLRQIQTSPGLERTPPKEQPQSTEPPPPPPKGDRPVIRLPSGEQIQDRRSGEDRRKQVDRRKSLDIVYKNRRFGGDRRKGDRRKKS